MSTFYDLKQVVLGCISRINSSFNTGTNNFVDIAINNAVIYAQRRVDFEWNKGIVKIAANPYGSIMIAQDSEGQAVQVKRIIKAFGVSEPNDNSHSIPYLSRVGQIADNTNRREQHMTCTGPKVIHEGMRVSLVPAPEGAHDLWFYAVKWMPRLTKGEDTNFLFTYAFDWLMYRSILELNFFIKEEERFPVTQRMLDDAWNTVVAWDANLVSITETETEL